MTLHTSPGCTLYQPMNASGTVLDTNCDAMQNCEPHLGACSPSFHLLTLVLFSDNTGCGVMDASSRSYGESLTKNGGGVFVMYMDESGISIWFFLASNIPDDIRSDAPAFRNWGLPRARFDATSCDMAKYFADQTLVINITLCGE